MTKSCQMETIIIRSSWDDVQSIYHSPEVKAVETARIVSNITGIPMCTADNLRELRVPVIKPEKEFVRRVGAYLAGFPDPGFEDWHHATNRIVNCVEKIVGETEGKSAAIVSHGRIMAVFFSHLLKRRITVKEWQSVRMPDLSIVDMDTWTVECGFLSETSV